MLFSFLFFSFYLNVSACFFMSLMAFFLHAVLSLVSFFLSFRSFGLSFFTYVPFLSVFLSCITIRFCLSFLYFSFFVSRVLSLFRYFFRFVLSSVCSFVSFFTVRVLFLSSFYVLSIFPSVVLSVALLFLSRSAQLLLVRR